MLKREVILDLSLSYPPDNHSIEKIAFFDIETTGFAADDSYLYLIGCIYNKNSSFYMIQWFSEEIDDEVLLITEFFEFLSEYKVLIHYNGTGFDIPYLVKKCKLLNLNYSFDSLISIDLYKRIYPYKKILKLNSYKQKSIETYMGINRKDCSDGGELIAVYQSYIGRKRIEELKHTRMQLSKENNIDEVFLEARIDPSSRTDELLQLLLLHNEDDIKGLVKICPILNYACLFEGPIRIFQVYVEANRLIIKFDVARPLPVSISLSEEGILLTACNNNATLSINIYEGELKHYYSSYKDYYYLPVEDTVIHKSLASYVAKEYKQRSTPANCYVKKLGLFVPQYSELITPCYRSKHTDKLSYIEVHTDFLLQEDTLERYVSHILNHMLISK